MTHSSHFLLICILVYADTSTLLDVQSTSIKSTLMGL